MTITTYEPTWKIRTTALDAELRRLDEHHDVQVALGDSAHRPRCRAEVTR